ncbi:MAG: EAL domain-containing protein [Bdellovibrionales bacterium]|jgi:EAL domain-containing protein (putative c-di-GMP-specific phosphodiesterase class I)
MRVWDAEDSRTAATSLVLEQDFILRIRRLHRLNSPHLVANVLLSTIPEDYSGRGPLRDAQRRLQALALAQKGTYAEMSNGDVFLIWPDTMLAKTFPHQAMMVALPNGVAPDDTSKFTVLFNLPQDYALLRERANHYVNESRAGESDEDENSPSRLLQSEAARGPLTAWTVDLIDRLVKEIDLCPFIRSQSVYEIQKDRSWKVLFDESYIGLEEVKQRFFPHIDAEQPRHLFLDLCHVLDRSLLQALTINYDSVSGMNLSLNLSLQTILGVDFAQFTHRIPRAARARIGFEVHCGDLLQDFAQSLSALETLHQEGYNVAIDGVTPDMIGFFNFTRLNVDFIKIKASRDHAVSFKYPLIRESIMHAPREKIIFYHCDSDQTLKAGVELGITKFQGWLIDDYARKWRRG